jgi:protein-glutamine gamma-glutamyltransferase
MPEGTGTIRAQQMNHRIASITGNPVFWVILPLALVILPHLPRLPWWIPVLVLILFAVRLGAVLIPQLMPGKFWLFLVAIMAATGTYIHYGTLIGKTAGTTILICLLAIKLLESQSTRDYMLLIALSFFIIVTNFFFYAGYSSCIGYEFNNTASR